MSKAQRLTWVLGACGVLMLALAIAQYFGVGAGYSLAPDSAGGDPPEQALNLDANARKLPPWPEFGGEMIARPIFNEDRKPTPASAKGTGEAQAQPLNAALTGVILAGAVKLALIKDNPSGKSVRLKLGQNLPGEQSPWRLVEVRPRSALFEASGLGQQELRLQVSDKPMAVVAGPAPAPAVAPPPGAYPPSAAPAAPAVERGQLKPQSDVNPDEIRKRIEERRKQLREEAQRMEQEQKHL
jgi:general secretion pathway protein N